MPDRGWPEVAPPPPRIDSGDAVSVVCWRRHGLPDDADAGEWTVVTGRVVSVRTDGTLVCFEMDNPVLPFGGTLDPTYNSPLRWTTPDRVFREQSQAEESARTLPRPN